MIRSKSQVMQVDKVGGCARTYKFTDKMSVGTDEVVGSREPKVRQIG